MTSHATPSQCQSRFTVSLDALEASAHVPVEDLVEERPEPRPAHDESTGHLPGNVRPYGA